MIFICIILVNRAFKQIKNKKISQINNKLQKIN